MDCFDSTTRRISGGLSLGEQCGVEVIAPVGVGGGDLPERVQVTAKFLPR